MSEPTLAHVPVSHLGETPAQWMLFLHGILGSKSNWRSIARRFVAARPAWGALLVDLRMHGQSRGFAPPHGVESAARDLLELDGHAGAPIRGVLGHSFGGKVALAYARAREAARDPLAHVFVVDSMPGARSDRRGSEGTVLVLELLRALGPRFETREAFVEQILAHGLSRDLATFLAMNLERAPDAPDAGFALRLDLDALGAMLDDYFAVDLWRLVESPPRGTRVHLLVGGRSPLFGPEDLARARTAAADAPDRVTLTVLAQAGHWVHTDAPDALVDALVDATA